MSVAAYRRREPEQSLVRRVVREHLGAFFDLVDSRTSGLPRYVRRAFEGYLRCGDLKQGFARVHCSGCGHDAVVAFS